MYQSTFRSTPSYHRSKLSQQQSIPKKAAIHFCWAMALMMTVFFTPACQQGNADSGNTEDRQPDKDAILATIEKETASFFARDYEAWKSTYAQTDYAFQAWSNRDGTFDASVGWNGIDNTVGKYIHENPEPQSSSHPIVERKNITYKFYGPEACYLTWDQFNSNKEGNNFLHSKEVRMMEKIDGQWKIVCVAAFWDYVNPIAADKLKEIQRMDKESRGTDKL